MPGDAVTRAPGIRNYFSSQSLLMLGLISGRIVSASIPEGSCKPVVLT